MPIWDAFRSGPAPRRWRRQARRRPGRLRRRLAHEPLEDRRLLAVGDVRVEFEFTDPGGSPLSSLQINDAFVLRALIQDARANPEGILKAYFDIGYPADLASVDGSITHGPNFNLSIAGDTSTPGLIDEVGGLDSDAFPPASPGDQFLLFSLPFRAARAGTFTLTPDAADSPIRDIRFFDLTAVPLNEIEFVGTSIEIVGAGIDVTPTSGLVTSEAGDTATFEIVLTQQPAANVTIGLSSSDTSEGTVSPSSVTFTPANWNAPQTVTATGVDDSLDDGDVAYTIVTAPATSGDADYSGRDADDVSVTNTDDDAAGISVSPTSGLITTEAGGTATLQIVLTSQPTANVTIGLASSDTTEGTVSPASVTFTSANWNVPRTVTATGVDDPLDDGDVAYTIVTAPATSGDADYSGRNAADVAVTNTDDDAPGISVAPTSGLVTSEAGGTAAFQIVLTSQPTSDVTIGLASSDTSEGTVSPASVTFTPGNWNAPRTITATGVDDPLDDGDVGYAIVTAPATSGDAAYDGRNASDVSVINTDDDAAGITVAPTSGLVTTEAGGTATFQIVLTSQPTAEVTIGLSSSDTSEGTVSPDSVTFTPGNWDMPRTVTATGVDDLVADGDVPYTIVTAAAASNDAGYDGRNAADVSVTNADNDAPGITVAPTSGLVTTEAGGTATFQIVLNSQPTEAVTIGLSSSDTSEGAVAPNSVTFTPGNWNTPQTVSASGIDDLVDDGDVPYTIVTAAATSGDADYSGRNAADVSVTNTDDDAAGITVAPTSGLVTTEAGNTATFQIVLTSQPTAAVTIGLSSSDTSEGTVSPGSVTFTPGNWDTPQTVSATGVDDLVDDGDADYTIVTAAAASSDAGYAGRNAADVSVTNTDDDVAGISVAPSSGLVTSEAGGTATFQIVLNSQPTAAVTIDLSSSDTSEGTVSPGSVTFTPGNWDTPQTVSATGVDDLVDDGDAPYTIVTAAAASSDASYDGRNAADVSVTNTDNDAAGITIAPTSELVTTEAGGTATFEIVLNSQPTAPVTIDLSSSVASEGTVSPSSVTFAPGDWDMPQTVTVTGVDDLIDDGDIPYTIVTAAAVSNDEGYSGRDGDDVSVTNTDDDEPGIVVAPTSGLETTEAGGSATFQVVLTSQPTSDVTVDFSSSDTGEGIFSPACVVFTPENWDTPQTATITGVDDALVDGDASYLIVTSAAMSEDPVFSGLDPADVSVTNLDNDSATLTLSGPLSMSEGTGGTTTDFTFTVTLSGAVQGGLSVAYATSDAAATVADGDYADNDGTLLFSGTDGETQTITVRVNQDARLEADEAFQVALGQITAAPGIAARISVSGSPAAATIVNDDTATLTLSGPEPLAEGTGGVTTDFVFTVTLSNDVQGGFSVEYITNDGSATIADADYVDNDGSLSFNGTAGETRTVTVQVRHDEAVETDEAFELALGSISGLDPSAQDDLSVNGSPATATIVNDDFPRLILAPLALAQNEGSGSSTSEFTFTVTLSDAVADPDGFDVPYFSNDGTATLAGGDYQDNDGILHFDGTTGETRTVTVLVNHDDVVEADETFVFDLGDITGLEPGEIVLTNGASATATIVNDDSATLALVPVLASQNEGTGGTTTDLTFTVTLSAAVAGGLDVQYATNDMSATAADGDYVDNDGILSFVGTAGEMHTITVQANHDAKLEPNEAFQVALGQLLNVDPAIAAAITVTGSPATGIIRNDDIAVLTLSGPVSLPEGTGGTTTPFAYTVTLSNAVQGGLSVEYATDDGTASVMDGDYLDNDGTLNFSGTAGETQTITVQVNQDAKVEADETFRLVLELPVPGDLTIADEIQVVGSPATGTIVNDDSATLTLSGPVSLPEGTGGVTTDFAFNLTLSNPVQGGLSIPYTTDDGTATVADTDYLDNDGTLSFNGTAGETQTITVQVNQDAKVEADETFEVTLGQLSAAAEIVGRISLSAGGAAGTIVNDDTATVAFATPASTVIEASESHRVDVVLNVSNGGTLSEAITVRVLTVPAGTTAGPADFAVQTTSVTFAAGSRDGDRRTIDLAITADEVMEENETVELALEIEGEGIGGGVTLGGPNRHVTTITDDPMTASVSGIVWVDANHNGRRDAGEAGLPGVTVMLSGRDLRDQIVEIVTITEGSGSYQFGGLPGGTYDVIETQPQAFHDGTESLGTVAGTPNGTALNDRFVGIMLEPAEQGINYDFAESGLRAQYVSNRMFLVSAPATASTLREMVALGEEREGDPQKAQAIRKNKTFEVRRIGSEVVVNGSSSNDLLTFVPASAASGDEHVVRLNGLMWSFPAADVRTFQLNGAGGDDQLVLHDSAADDTLEAGQDAAILSSQDFRVEAMAFELVRAVSENGGQDRLVEQAIDFVLRLVGDWQEL